MVQIVMSYIHEYYISGVKVSWNFSYKLTYAIINARHTSSNNQSTRNTHKDTIVPPPMDCQFRLSWIGILRIKLSYVLCTVNLWRLDAKIN